MKKAFYITSILVYCFITLQAHPIDLSVKVPLTLDFVSINGQPHAYYELVLTNFHSDTLRLKKLEVLDTSDSRVLFSSEKGELQGRFGENGSKEDQDMQLLPPGSSSVVYVELQLENPSTDEIVHQITFDGPNIRDTLMESVPTHCVSRNPLVLGKPLNSGGWAAIYDPKWERGHRRVIYHENGQARIPGRYAIDFIKVNEQGYYAKGDDNFIRNWFGYGADVLAVADGTVVARRDDFPESNTLSGHPAYDSGKAAGNYISIKMDNGKFAFYEHLKPHSVNVILGQRVKRGDVIGSLGLTGQGTSPHLHFHVADTNSLLGAEGVPFVFEEFEVLGGYSNFEDFGKLPWQPWEEPTSSHRQKERPMPNTVIQFN